uniref:Homeobox domain-containing protein n=1 Tax=Globodera rostochiensis TaxID=31243 RepID=A0A914HA28_GLORO
MRFSRDQLGALERAYYERHYLSQSDRENLGAAIGVAEWQIKMWFQNRRAKNKRMDKEEAVQLFSQSNAAAGITLAVPEQSVVAAAAPSAAAATAADTVRAAKSANRCGKGKGRRRAVTARTKTTRHAAGGKRKSRHGAVAAAAADK